MQPNTISYTFDHDNDGGTTPAVSVTLNRYREALDSTIYATSLDTSLSINQSKFYRTDAKRSGNFYGTDKVAYKRSVGKSVPTVDGGTTIAPIIVEVSASLPVGTSDADRLSAVMELIGFLTSTDGKAAMISLFQKKNV